MTDDRSMSVVAWNEHVCVLWNKRSVAVTVYSCEWKIMDRSVTKQRNKKVLSFCLQRKHIRNKKERDGKICVL